MAPRREFPDQRPAKGISSGPGKWLIFLIVSTWSGFTVLALAWLVSTSLRSDQELFADAWGLPGKSIPLAAASKTEGIKDLLDGKGDTSWKSEPAEMPSPQTFAFSVKEPEEFTRITIQAGQRPELLPAGSVRFFAGGEEVVPVGGPRLDSSGEKATYGFEPFEAADITLEVTPVADAETGLYGAEIAEVSAFRSKVRFHWANYRFAWTVARMGEYAANSAIVTAVSVTCIVFISAMAAYAITKTRFFGSRALFYYFLAGMAVPASLLLVPLFMTLKNLNIKNLALFSIGDYWLIHIKDFYLMDSRFGLILIYTTLGIPFTVFILTAFFRTLPSALAESAAIDGASEYGTFWHIFLPLAKPGIVTVSIFNFLFVWNEYQFALVFISNESLKTLPVGLYDLSLASQHSNNWTALFAGLVMLMIPTIVIFLILQDRITRGLTVGAIKE